MKLIKKMLVFGLTLVVMMGLAPSSNAYYSSQDSFTDFLFKKEQKPEVLNNDIQLLEYDEKTNSLLLKIDMKKYETATFNLEYEKNISDWTFNLGDSISNDGWGGDAGDQSHDAEIEIVNKDLNGYLSDEAPKDKRIAIDEAKILKDSSTMSITLNSNGSLSWTNNQDKKGKFKSPYLFALNGQKDREGTSNYDVFVGLNRVITGSKTGTGLKSATINLVKKTDIIPTKELLGAIEEVSIPETVNFREQLKVTVSGYLPNPSYKIKELKVTKTPSVHGGVDCIFEGTCPNLPFLITVTPVMEKIADDIVTIEIITPYKESTSIKMEDGWNELIVKVVGSNQTIEKKVKTTNEIIIPNPEKTNEVNLRGIFKKSDNENYEYQLIGLNGNLLVYLNSGDQDINYADYLDKGVKISGIRTSNKSLNSELCSSDKAEEYSDSKDSLEYKTKYNNKEIEIEGDADKDYYAEKREENEDDSESDYEKKKHEDRRSKEIANQKRKNTTKCFLSNRFKEASIVIKSISLIETGESLTNSLQDKINAEIIPFIDIDESNWAKDYIKNLKFGQVINGFQDGTFKPEKSITYAEAGKMVLKSFGIDYEEYSSESVNNPKLADWQKQVAVALFENGIIDNVDEFSKYANFEAKRGDIIKMLIKGSGIETNTPSGQYFRDVTVFEEEAPYIEKAKELEIVKGYEDGTFRPNSNVRRDEFAKMVSETLEKI